MLVRAYLGRDRDGVSECWSAHASGWPREPGRGSAATRRRLWPFMAQTIPGGTAGPASVYNSTPKSPRPACCMPLSDAVRESGRYSVGTGALSGSVMTS
jgi:hypothetical protein